MTCNCRGGSDGHLGVGGFIRNKDFNCPWKSPGIVNSEMCGNPVHPCFNFFREKMQGRICRCRPVELILNLSSANVSLVLSGN